jgi:iduronate 2-sulfatase
MKPTRYATLLVMPLLLVAGSLRAGETHSKLNVLFILADDLRCELGCYGSVARTPNLDALAKRGTLFERAYCQQALCNPSRSSFLTGLRPDTLQLWHNGTHFREQNPNVVTLPQHFLQQGYQTRCVGKIFHNWHTKDKGDRRSWSANEFLHYENHGNDKPQATGELPPNQATAPHCERRDVPDEAYFDGRVAQEAVRVLREIKEQPFFLAVGFWKPHAPFNAPARYWDLYQRDKLPPYDPNRPQDAPEVAFHDSRELRGVPPKQRDFTRKEATEMRHGYFANISYFDAQLGKVLAALDELKLRDKTLIVFAGDHGYHIGEQSLWAKTSNFELDARVPLLISAPGQATRGTRTAALVELLDLFPTLVDLADLPKPSELEGQSLKPLLDDPARRGKDFALTQHPRPAYFDRTPAGTPEFMGYSIRTERYRYTQWRAWPGGEIKQRELYDLSQDGIETKNLAKERSEVVEKMDRLLAKPAAR